MRYIHQGEIFAISSQLYKEECRTRALLYPEIARCRSVPVTVGRISDLSDMYVVLVSVALLTSLK